MKATSKLLRHLAPVLLALAVAGCSGLLRSNAPRCAGLHAAGHRPPHPITLQLRPYRRTRRYAWRTPAAEAGLGTSQIVLLQSDHRLNVYAASAWAADAPVLLESLAVADSARVAVIGARSRMPRVPSRPITCCRSRSAHFDADYSDDTGAPPTVQVTLDCTLGSEEGRDIIATFVASGSAVASANRLGEVVAAFQQATDAAMTSLAQQAAAAARPRGMSAPARLEIPPRASRR